MDIGALDQFVDAIKTEPEDRNNTYSAIVSKIDNEGTAWVYIAGSDKEAPVSGSASEIKKGDAVVVEWRSNRLFITGNDTNPSAGVGRVDVIEESALEAITNASIARDSADSAKADAESAKASAAEAKETTDEINAYAETAGKTVTQILEDGETAGAAAQRAQDSADSAIDSANTAFDQLSYIEDIVGVLELLRTNGNYQVTQDLTPQPQKWYFLRSGTGTTADPYRYEVVPSPSSIQYALSTDESVDSAKTYYERSGTGTSEDPYVYIPITPAGTEDPSDEGWYECLFYELVGIQESIQNYVSSQLAVTDAGLWLKRPDYTGIQTKVLLSSTDGVVLYGPNGTIIGKYGETAQIGDATGFHIEIDGTEIGFYQAENKVAYINNNQLYITQSVVLQQMDLGETVLNGGLGQWSWKIHANGQTPSRNNLNLKWIG